MKKLMNYLNKILCFLGKKPKHVMYKWNEAPYKRCNLGCINRQSELKLTEDDISSILESGGRDNLSVSMLDIDERHPEYITDYFFHISDDFVELSSDKNFWADIYVSDRVSIHLIKVATVDGDFPSYPDGELVEQLNFVMARLKKDTQHNLGKRITGTILLANKSTNQYMEYGHFTFNKELYGKTLRRLLEGSRSELNEIYAA